MPEYVSLPIAEVQTFEKNPRKGDVDAIAQSLAKRGQYRPIVVNAGTLTGRRNEVLAGNHTMMAARQLGWESIDVALIDVDEQTAREIVAADNRLADLGGYDQSALFDLLSSLDSLDGTGYTQTDFAALEHDLFPPEPRTDPDDVPPKPVNPMSKDGQIWRLGRHRLLVGSATDLAAVRRLCGGVAPDAVWTDPPYGVDYVGKTKAALTIRNDSSRGLGELLNGAFRVVADVCRAGAPVYVAHADTERVTFESSLIGAGLLVRQNLVWVKNTLVMGRSDYHYQHEPILEAQLDGPEPPPAEASGEEHEPVLYGFTAGGEGRLGRGGPHWHGDNKQSTVFQIPKPPRNKDHPTMKPVALIGAMLSNSLPPGGVVFDPFAGSGSTLIAAHRLGGRAFCVELDPRYADVIIRRFEEHTGETAELEWPVAAAAS